MRNLRIVFCYLIFRIFRDMNNHIASKGKARDMHQYLTEVYRSKTARLLERAHHKKFE